MNDGNIILADKEAYIELFEDMIKITRESGRLIWPVKKVQKDFCLLYDFYIENNGKSEEAKK